MKIPKRIEPLVEEGLLDEVVRQLMSGKEATVYVVRCGNELRCAKVYKDAQQRNFRQSTAYQEGRKVKNSREGRARGKGTRFGARCSNRHGRAPRGVIHGDLSEYNILLGVDGPVIIDLPQAVDAAGNSGAAAMLERDVGNLAARFAPQLLVGEYGKEIWALYQAGLLVPGVKLSGRVAADERPADPGAVLRELAVARKEAREEAAQRLAEQA